jgi:hypothetical protein
VINSVGPELLKWPIGQEPAFTLIPNFLASGIAAVTIGGLAIIWSLFFIHRRHSAFVPLLLFIAQTLVGGGLGYAVFYLTVCAYATRINKPLKGWQRILSPKMRRSLGQFWMPIAAASAILFLVLLQTAVFGFFWEAVGSARLMNLILASLLVTFGLMHLAFAAVAQYLQSGTNPRSLYLVEHLGRHRPRNRSSPHLASSCRLKRR